MAARMRLDLLLVARGLAETRARAQALVMAGKVSSDGRRLDKPGSLVAPDIALSVAGPAHPWVSRGGQKLAHALAEFGLSPAGRVGLDIGASTGGFTDVLLQGGAVRIYAVDVGHGQLDWRLRQDPRVVVLERTNARHLTSAAVPEPVGCIVCDASFIGLRTVLPAPLMLAAPDAWLVALIKPQFEVGPERVGRGGVVRDPEAQAWACRVVRDWLAGRPGWQVLGVTDSPIRGPKGNKELLIAARRSA